MPSVVFASDMLAYTDGQPRVEIDASSYREAVRVLNQQFPQLTERLCARYAVAIDDVLIQEPLLESLASNSEVIFLPKIAGG